VDHDEAVTYRLAYALADELAEAMEHNLPNRFRLNPVAGGTTEAIVVEVLRRMGTSSDEGSGLGMGAGGDPAVDSPLSSATGPRRSGQYESWLTTSPWLRDPSAQIV
jgi:hypothetical protein